MKTFIIFIVLLLWARSCNDVQNNNIFLKGNNPRFKFAIQELKSPYKLLYLTALNSNIENNVYKYSGKIAKYIFREDDASYSVDTLATKPTEQFIIPDTATSFTTIVTNTEIVSLDSTQFLQNDTTKTNKISIKNTEMIPLVADITIKADTIINDSNTIINSEIVPTVTNPSITTDSIKSDSSIVIKTDTTVTPTDSTKVSPWIKSLSLGFNLGYLLERNNPLAPNTDVITFTSAFNLGLGYYKDSSKFEMTNELHYISSIQNESITGGVRLKRIQDDLTTLHDFSYGISKNNKFKANLILRCATPVFTIYDGDYYKDYNNLGATQGFLSPYDFVVSPGVKYQPNEFLRMSFSIYAFQLYGITNSKIADKGIFITDYDENCKFKKFLFKHLGAEFNLWYDGQIKEWLFVQYRLSVSTDFFESFGKNGLVDGLFITKIKVFKDFYISHQAIIKTNFAVNFLKPFYNQMLLFTYDKSF